MISIFHLTEQAEKAYQFEIILRGFRLSFNIKGVKFEFVAGLILNLVSVYYQQ